MQIFSLYKLYMYMQFTILKHKMHRLTPELYILIKIFYAS